MFLAPDGIKCDLCQTEYRQIFTYYSYDIVPIQSRVRLPAGYRKLKPAGSRDVCTICWEKHKDLLLRHALYLKDGIVCDLCGNVHKVNFDFLFIKVTKIDVDVATKQTITDKDFLELTICKTHGISLTS